MEQPYVTGYLLDVQELETAPEHLRPRRIDFLVTHPASGPGLAVRVGGLSRRATIFAA